MSQPAPPQYSPDGRFFWNGQQWLPVPAVQQKTGWGCGRIFLVVAGLVVAVVIIGALASGGHSPSTSGNSTSNVSTSSPEPSPTAIDPATYKASGKSIPYPQLEKDPASLTGTVVTYTGQVVQYDTATTTSHLRVNVTPDGFGGYVDTIWLDVNPADTDKVFRGSVIRFWGEVLGAYTYTSVSGGQITIPEVNARFIEVVS
jgi:hypothetical protein